MGQLHVESVLQVRRALNSTSSGDELTDFADGQLLQQSSSRPQSFYPSSFAFSGACAAGLNVVVAACHAATRAVHHQEVEEEANINRRHNSHTFHRNHGSHNLKIPWRMAQSGHQDIQQRLSTPQATKVASSMRMRFQQCPRGQTQRADKSKIPPTTVLATTTSH